MTGHGGDWAGFLQEHGKMPLDFSANISPLGMPEGVLAAAVRALAESERYPDPQCRALRKKLSEVHGVAEEAIVCGNGAADLIYRLCRCLRPKKALLPVPTFTEYEAAFHTVGCGTMVFPLLPEEDFLLDTDAFIESIQKDLDVVFLCNPNNPTGRLTDRASLRRILSACREKGISLVLDECFLDFTEHPEQITMTGELAEWQNLVILRAFTKTFAMAGLRLGYAFCGDTLLAEKLTGSEQPWPVSHPAQAAGVAALAEAEYTEKLRMLISMERERMHTALTALGLRVIPGKANFLLFYSGDDMLCEKLGEKGILIRSCAAIPGLGKGWYRTAVRTPQENERLLAAMEEVLANG